MVYPRPFTRPDEPSGQKEKGDRPDRPFQIHRGRDGTAVKFVLIKRLYQTRFPKLNLGKTRRLFWPHPTKPHTFPQRPQPWSGAGPFPTDKPLTEATGTPTRGVPTKA